MVKFLLASARLAINGARNSNSDISALLQSIRLADILMSTVRYFTVSNDNVTIVKIIRSIYRYYKSDDVDEIFSTIPMIFDIARLGKINAPTVLDFIAVYNRKLQIDDDIIKCSKLLAIYASTNFKCYQYFPSLIGLACIGLSLKLSNYIQAEESILIEAREYCGVDVETYLQCETLYVRVSNHI